MLNFFQVSETSNGLLDGIGVRTPLLYGTNSVEEVLTTFNVMKNSKKAVTSFQQGAYTNNSKLDLEYCIASL